MHYEGNIIRPPSEANSILLQVTVGCSHNKCTFCGAYKGERFKIKKDPVIMEDIEFAARHCRRQNRLFICDGDALIIPQRRLVPILEQINQRLPWIERIGLYANTKSIRMKSDQELEQLRSLGVKIAYMGLETGDDVTLKAINKGADAQRMIEMGRKIRGAGIKLSITVLNGIAGRKRSMIHANETGRVLTAIDPEYVGALSLMLIPGTPMYDSHAKGEFELINPDEILLELGAMISATHLTNGLFHANHASNYLPIRAELPRDKERTLAHIAKALEGKIELKPEFMRAL
ncbi:putative oxygen-independent coproporphyrinogen III oxidase [Desulforapulum autotrophicum HRM2]|uniref:Oxygen-independent coproporphyrinogen III oxidase n=1 Tax=Desulforapulum autotrophicum (strain ATCC 43914 / DSM 3382 / VKM B-1955 / HRM2) TaxID=177437 RepID=C0QIB7_DESAH|nr:radical SAM protein [Desulforapulum autotrophicum]ACN17861.1 putative oxygen-independent coproporphyrinogen III oxidase [Desulforapulum autotrophicum HRM2]